MTNPTPTTEQIMTAGVAAMAAGRSPRTAALLALVGRQNVTDFTEEARSMARGIRDDGGRIASSYEGWEVYGAGGSQVLVATPDGAPTWSTRPRRSFGYDRFAAIVAYCAALVRLPEPAVPNDAYKWARTCPAPYPADVCPRPVGEPAAGLSANRTAEITYLEGWYALGLHCATWRGMSRAVPESRERRLELGFAA